MFSSHRLRRVAALLIGAAVLAMAAGCGVDQRKDEAQSAPAVTESQRQTMQMMNEAAEQAFTSVASGDLEQAKARLAQLSVLSTKLTYDGIATAEGMQAVAETITRATQELNAVHPDQVRVSMRVASARLTVDALAHRDQPMWLEYKPVMKQDLERMANAVEARSDPEASQALSLWRGHVSIVRPAVTVSRGSSETMKLDSITAFLENGVRAAEWEEMKMSLPGIVQAVDDLFASKDQETLSPLLPTAEPPHPIIWSLTLGFFIIAVLAYVAWRKYTADQGVVRVKKEHDFDLD